MRVIIAGGAGFIGSHLVDHYRAAGAAVVVIDNLITSHERNIARHRGSPGFEFIRADICSLPPVEGAVDLILHFASPASPFDYLKYPLETMRTAATGTANLLELARAKNARLLLASTSEVYGDPAVHPQVEDYWGNVNPVGPRSVYDESKRYAEAITSAYHRRYGQAVNIVRIFNTYGERMRPGDGRVIPSLINQALAGEPMTIFGDGMQTRSFCYVQDMVAGIARMAEIDYPRPVNVGNPNEFTVLELASLIQRLTGTNSPIQHLPLPEDDPRKRKPDISRARSLLGWEPRVGLEQGLRAVIEWFRGQRDRVA